MEPLAYYLINAKMAKILTIVLLLGGVSGAFCQLDAPGAFSDFAGCAHHTCTWVPFIVKRTFRRGEFSYTVEAKGAGTGGFFVLNRGDKELLRADLDELDASVSVVWSDDDRFFAVTWSDGGAIGGFHVRVFRIDGDSVTELPAWQRAWSVFKRRHWCETRGDNIQAYSWLPDPRRLILVLSVYPTGDCGAETGYTEAFVVDAATGDIQQHWGIRKLNEYMRLHPE